MHAQCVTFCLTVIVKAIIIVNIKLLLNRYAIAVHLRVVRRRRLLYLLVLKYSDLMRLPSLGLELKYN